MDPYAARVGLVAIRGTLTVASSHKLVGVIGADIKIMRSSSLISPTLRISTTVRPW